MSFEFQQRSHRHMMEHHPHLSKFHAIKQVAESFDKCGVISTTYDSCVVIAPDQDQAIGVQEMLRRNGIRPNKLIAGHFTDCYYLTIQYKE